MLSRQFVDEHPIAYNEEVFPFISHFNFGMTENIKPTDTHKFCSWLHNKGWLRRVYTQNVDGLHLHSDFAMDPLKVVECHGSLERDDLVLYGDPIPSRFYNCCDEDFPLNPNQQDDADPVDLCLVFGTSLQVLPFAAVPNLCPRGCTRVLVNRSLRDCGVEEEASAKRTRRSHKSSTVKLGSRKRVNTRNLWTGREGNKRWRQLLVAGDCDDFVQRFFLSSSFEKDS